MTYELVFDQRALKEFKKLGATIKQQFKNKLAQVLENLHIPANKLSGMTNCYKIKLRSAGYRLVYQVQDEQVVVFVVAVGKREGNEAYDAASQRLGDLEPPQK